jgi:hypothetical protein
MQEPLIDKFLRTPDISDTPELVFRWIVTSVASNSDLANVQTDALETGTCCTYAEALVRKLAGTNRTERRILVDCLSHIANEVCINNRNKATVQENDTDTGYIVQKTGQSGEDASERRDASMRPTHDGSTHVGGESNEALLTYASESDMCVEGHSDKSSVHAQQSCSDLLPGKTSRLSSPSTLVKNPSSKLVKPREAPQDAFRMLVDLILGCQHPLDDFEDSQYMVATCVFACDDARLVEVYTNMILDDQESQDKVLYTLISACIYLFQTMTEAQLTAMLGVVHKHRHELYVPDVLLACRCITCDNWRPMCKKTVYSSSAAKCSSSAAKCSSSAAKCSSSAAKCSSSAAKCSSSAANRDKDTTTPSLSAHTHKKVNLSCELFMSSFVHEIICRVLQRSPPALSFSCILRMVIEIVEIDVAMPEMVSLLRDLCNIAYEDWASPFLPGSLERRIREEALLERPEHGGFMLKPILEFSVRHSLSLGDKCLRVWAGQTAHEICQCYFDLQRPLDRDENGKLEFFGVYKEERHGQKSLFEYVEKLIKRLDDQGKVQEIKCSQLPQLVKLLLHQEDLIPSAASVLEMVLSRVESFGVLVHRNDASNHEQTLALVHRNDVWNNEQAPAHGDMDTHMSGQEEHKQTFEAIVQDLFARPVAQFTCKPYSDKVCALVQLYIYTLNSCDSAHAPEMDYRYPTVQCPPNHAG